MAKSYAGRLKGTNYATDDSNGYDLGGHLKDAAGILLSGQMPVRATAGATNPLDDELKRQRLLTGTPDFQRELAQTKSDVAVEQALSIQEAKDAMEKQNRANLQAEYDATQPKQPVQQAQTDVPAGVLNGPTTPLRNAPKIGDASSFAFRPGQRQFETVVDRPAGTKREFKGGIFQNIPIPAKTRAVETPMSEMTNRKYTEGESRTISSADAIGDSLNKLRGVVKQDQSNYSNATGFIDKAKSLGTSGQFSGSGLLGGENPALFGFDIAKNPIRGIGEQGQKFSLYNTDIANRLLYLRSGAQINEKEYDRLTRQLPSLFRGDELDLEQLDAFQKEFEGIGQRVRMGALWDASQGNFITPGQEGYDELKAMVDQNAQEPQQAQPSKLGRFTIVRK